jgi:hypothetical protein
MVGTKVIRSPAFLNSSRVRRREGTVRTTFGLFAIFRGLVRKLSQNWATPGKVLQKQIEDQIEINLTRVH